MPVVGVAVLVLTFSSMAAIRCEPTAPIRRRPQEWSTGRCRCSHSAPTPIWRHSVSITPILVTASSPSEPSEQRKLCTSDGCCKLVRDHLERNHIVHICRQRCNLRSFRTPASIFAGAAQSPWVYRLSPEPHRCSGAIGPYSKRTLDKPG